MWDWNARLCALWQLCIISWGFTGELTQTLNSGDVWIQREVNALALRELNSHWKNVWVVILDCDDMWGSVWDPCDPPYPHLQPHQINPQSRWDPSAVHVTQLLDKTPHPLFCCRWLAALQPCSELPRGGALRQEGVTVGPRSTAVRTPKGSGVAWGTSEGSPLNPLNSQHFD